MTATLKAVMSASLAVVLLAVHGSEIRAEEGRVLNRLLDTVGSFKDGTIYGDKDMKVAVGSYKEKKVLDDITVVEIYDGKMMVVGRVHNGNIYDSTGKLLGTSKGNVVFPFLGADFIGSCDAKGGIPAAAYLLLLRRRAPN